MGNPVQLENFDFCTELPPDPQEGGERGGIPQMESASVVHSSMACVTTETALPIHLAVAIASYRVAADDAAHSMMPDSEKDNFQGASKKWTAYPPPQASVISAENVSEISGTNCVRVGTRRVSLESPPPPPGRGGETSLVKGGRGCPQCLWPHRSIC